MRRISDGRQIINVSVKVRKMSVPVGINAKKSTAGNPFGLPSVALAKDGGRNRTRIYDLHDVNVAL